MIIKKKQAQRLMAQRQQQQAAVALAQAYEQSQAHHASHSQATMTSPMHAVDPAYHGALSFEDFDSGRLPDRRKRNREIEQQKEQLQEEMQVAAQEIIFQAEQEANAIRERAQQEGFEEGLAQAQPVIDNLQQTIQEFLFAREAAYESVNKDLADMALAIAKKIMAVEISCDEALVMAVVRKTIQQVSRDQKYVTIWVNPTDVTVVKEQLKADSPFGADVLVNIESNEDVDSGSCMVESQAGLIDARFSTQLQVLDRMIKTNKADAAKPKISESGGW